jgi:hypothetical protein
MATAKKQPPIIESFKNVKELYFDKLTSFAAASEGIEAIIG